MFLGKVYPFYGVIWHPEKNAHEDHPLIAHSPDAIECSKYFIKFFLNEALKDKSFGNDYKKYQEKVDIYDTHDVMKMKYIYVFEG